MIDLQGSGPLMGMKGIHPIQGIINIPVVCIRKNVTTQIKPLLKGNSFFAMYSTPALKDNPAALKYSKFWCHPFRDPSQYIKTEKPLELMSESDFIDPLFVYVDKKEKDKKWDFFYMTINNDSGFKNKGLHEFIQSLKVLVLERKLRGLILPYFPDNVKKWQVSFSDEERRILDKCEDRLTIKFGWKGPEDINAHMQACRFGFFPNVVDCSPRLLAECLIRNIPAIVNKDIWGGWKYINNQTGCLFDVNNNTSLNEAINLIQKQESLRPKKWFLENYGFQNSSERLAAYVNKYIRDTGCTHMYFDRFGSILKTLRRRMRKE